MIVGALAGALGWVVTDVSCRSDGGTGCPGWAALLSAVSFLAAVIGVGLVLALAFRSLAEWREKGSGPAQDQ
ncbi:MAG: hypothetical protein KY394_07000 [Actinobacteria bacterium]|nr:hypothetical protein [Actinomycetota bacterium]